MKQTLKKTLVGLLFVASFILIPSLIATAFVAKDNPSTTDPCNSNLPRECEVIARPSSGGGTGGGSTIPTDPNPPTTEPPMIPSNSASGSVTVIVLQPGEWDNDAVHVPDSCTIKLGESSCLAGFSWRVYVSPGEEFAVTTPNNFVVSTDPTAGVEDYKIEYPSRSFFFYRGGIEIKSINILAICDPATSSWSSTEKKCVKSTIVEGGTCSDGIKNQNETGIDVGGKCNDHPEDLCPKTEGVQLTLPCPGEQDLCPNTKGVQTALPCPDNYCPPPTTQTTNTECSLRDGTRAISGSVTMVQTKIPSTCTFGAPLYESETCVYPCLPGSFWDPIKKDCRNPVVSFSVRDCRIELGKNNCLSSVDWSININKKFDITTPDRKLVTNQNIPIGEKSWPIEYPSRNFYLYVEGSIEPLVVRTAKATCVDGTKWSVGENKCIKSTIVECDNGATNPPKCTTKDDGKCINGATNPPDCTFIADKCPNGATNPPKCTTGEEDKCLNKATNPPECTMVEDKCTNKATNPPKCTIKEDGKCLNGATNPPDCTTIEDKCTNGATNYPTCKNECALGMSWSVPQSKCIPECKDSWCKVLSRSANDCQIELGKNSCVSEIEWSTEYITGSFALTTPDYITISKELFGKVNYKIEYPSRNFFFYNNGEKIGEFNLKAICVEGSTWSANENKCISSTPEQDDPYAQTGDWGPWVWNNCIAACEYWGSQTAIRTCTKINGICTGPDFRSVSCFNETKCSGPVVDGENPLNISLTPNPAVIFKGRSSSLEWASSGTLCVGRTNNTEIFNTGNKNEGFIKVSPLKTTTYTITCTKDGVSDSRSKSIKVNNISIIES